MTDDPYQILGVPRAAKPDEIRKAYRKRAKELHPDLHPGDKEVEAKFKALSAAYHLLNDPEQRARFDRGEIDASGLNGRSSSSFTGTMPMRITHGGMDQRAEPANSKTCRTSSRIFSGGAGQGLVSRPAGRTSTITSNSSFWTR